MLWNTELFMLLFCLQIPSSSGIRRDIDSKNSVEGLACVVVQEYFWFIVF